MQPAIFITYSSKDEKVARTICTALENRGLACWISSRNVKPGQNYQEQIVKAIRAAKVMVLVFTANANNSNEIKKELALASQNNLIVIPVRIQDVAPNDAFAYEFATRQWIDLFDNWESSIARLVELIATTLHDHPSGDRAIAGLTGGDQRAQAAVAAAEWQKKPAKSGAWVLAGALAAACLAVLVVGTFAYLKLVQPSTRQVMSQTQPSPAPPKVAAEQSAPPVPSQPRPSPTPPKAAAAEPSPPQLASPPQPSPAPSNVTAELSPRQVASPPQPSPPPPKAAAEPDPRQADALVSAPKLAEADTRQGPALVPEMIPIISDHARNAVRTEYMPAPGHKALAISTGPYAMITGQADDGAAKTAALDLCQQRAAAMAQSRRCELYAVGNTVVYARGPLPLPPKPWFTPDPSIEIPVAVKDIPLVGHDAKSVLERYYVPGRKTKVLAIATSGSYAYYTNQGSVDEAVRRVLEACASYSGLACRVIALDDNFVVPIPTTMKAVGFFDPASDNSVAPELREDLARRIGNAPSGWTAIAVGAKGRVGVKLKAASEDEAIDGALSDCAKQNRACRVIAIGLFAVEPK